MRENRKLRLEIILGLLQELKSPKDSVKRQIHETYFNDIKTVIDIKPMKVLYTIVCLHAT